MKVAVLGASGGIGQVRDAIPTAIVVSLLTLPLQPLSLLCKICPLIDELALYDVINTPGVTADLSHISSVAVSCPIFVHMNHDVEGV
jgi:malate dehydrogenase